MQTNVADLCIVNSDAFPPYPPATSFSLMISFNRALCIKLQNGKKRHPNMQQPGSNPFWW